MPVRLSSLVVIDQKSAGGVLAKRVRLRRGMAGGAQMEQGVGSHTGSSNSVSLPASACNHSIPKYQSQKQNKTKTEQA